MANLTPEKLGENESEYSQQVALFAWVSQNLKVRPALGMLFAIKNEEKSGSAIAGARFKAAGVRAGVPDLFLAQPCGQYAGLFIEMKKRDGKVSDSQKIWHEKLRKNFYRVEVCWSWVEAKGVIESYLDEGGF